MTPDLKNSSRPFQRSGAHDGLYCDGVSLETLARKYGTPLYVYSADQIVERLATVSARFCRARSSCLLCGEGEFVAGDSETAGGTRCGIRHCFGWRAGAACIAAAPNAVGRVVFSGVGKTAVEIDLRASMLGFFNSMWRAKRNLTLLAKRARKLKNESAVCAARQSGRICGDASVHFYGAARAQVRDRHSQGSGTLSRGGAESSGWSRMESACTSGRRFDRRSRLARRWSGCASWQCN